MKGNKIKTNRMHSLVKTILVLFAMVHWGSITLASANDVFVSTVNAQGAEKSPTIVQQKESTVKMLIANAKKLPGQATTDAFSPKIIGQFTFTFYRTLTAMALAECHMKQDLTLCETAYGQWADLHGYLGFSAFHVSATYTRYLVSQVVNPFSVTSLSLAAGSLVSRAVDSLFYNPYMNLLWDA